MKTNIFKFDTKEVLQIYINKQEESNQEVISSINDLKQTYKNVCIFVSGNKEINLAIKEIINYMQMSSTT